MNEYFHPLEAKVLLRSGGVQSPHQLYRNDANELFARKGAGYIRLMAHQATSKPNVFWADIRFGVPGQNYTTSGGRLVFTPANLKKAA